MSNYKSRYTGQQIDDTLDAVIKLSPSMVRVNPVSDNKYILELGKSYLLKGDGNNGSWNMFVSVDAAITKPGFENSRRLTYLNLPDYNKYSSNIKLCVLGFDGAISGSASPYRHEVQAVYDVISSSVSSTADRRNSTVISAETASMEADFMDYLTYEIAVTGATDVFLCNDDATIYAEPGDSVFVRYSAYSDGTNFTETRTKDQNYVGFATGREAPPNKEDYEWVSYGSPDAINLMNGESGGVYMVHEEYPNIASGKHSFAVGRGSVASGAFSHAEGSKGITSSGEVFSHEASGNTSHVEGMANLASGNASHAEGIQTIASGQASHTEGTNTVANNLAAHAEGGSTTASGNSSHAEGFRGVASGNKSHAEGYRTQAIGTESHAEGCCTITKEHASHSSGYGTIASAEGQTVVGISNEENPDALFIVGNGEVVVEPSGAVGSGNEGEFIRKNAFQVLKNGDMNVEGSFAGMRSRSDCLGYRLKSFEYADGVFSLLTAATVAGDEVSCSYDVGDVLSITLLEDTFLDVLTVTYASGSTVICSSSISSFAGESDPLVFNPSAKAFSEEYSYTIFCRNKPGTGVVKVPNENIAVGYNNTSYNKFTVVAGRNNIVAGVGAVAFGAGNIASGENSFISGDNSTVSGANSSVFGNDTIVSAANAFAAGNSNNISANGAVAFGQNNTISGTSSVAIGKSHNITAHNSVALNDENTVSSARALATGYKTKVSGKEAATFGLQTEASNEQAFAQGHTTVASGQRAASFGLKTAAKGANSFAMGESTTASGRNSLAIGDQTKATAENAVAFHDRTKATAVDSFAIGQETEASYGQAFAQGYLTKATAARAVAFGSHTEASARDAHAGGTYCVASHNESFAHGSHLATTRNSGAVVGAYNDNTSSWAPSALFTVGIGDSSKRANGFMVIKHPVTGDACLVVGSTMISETDIQRLLDMLD